MIKYNINRDEKVVEAFFENTTYDLIDRVAKRMKLRQVFPNLDDLHKNVDSLDSYHLSKLRLKDKYSARVVCKDGDSFDEDLGKLYARVALLKKYNQAENKKVVSWMGHLLDFKKNCEKTGHYPAIFDDIETRTQSFMNWGKDEK